MPQTLSQGATGADVVLLQTHLNALPSALPPLDADGIFGPQTLRRVIEFQAQTFVSGVVEAQTWDALLGAAPPVPQPLRPTLYVQGQRLYDPTGKPVVLRGINLPLLDHWDFPASDKLADLAVTGANTVRIQWYIDYPNPLRHAYDLANLDMFLDKCKANGIIPILGLWDATCGEDISTLNSHIVPWWTRADVTAVLDKHKQYLIVNPANELGVFRWAGGQEGDLVNFKEAYKTALTEMRQTLHMPLMLDAPDCGTSIEVWNRIGQELLDHDPDHNLLLSVHAYWAGYDGIPFIADTVARNLPVVFGEIANKQVGGMDDECFYDLDGQGGNQPANGFTYQSLLLALAAQDIGWLAWSWWPDKCDSRQMAEYDAAGQFARLTPYGNDIVNNPAYGLKQCARKADAFQ